MWLLPDGGGTVGLGLYSLKVFVVVLKLLVCSFDEGITLPVWVSVSDDTVITELCPEVEGVANVELGGAACMKVNQNSYNSPVCVH